MTISIRYFHIEGEDIGKRYSIGEMEPVTSVQARDILAHTIEYAKESKYNFYIWDDQIDSECPLTSILFTNGYYSRFGLDDPMLWLRFPDWWSEDGITMRESDLHSLEPEEWQEIFDETLRLGVNPRGSLVKAEYTTIKGAKVVINSITNSGDLPVREPRYPEFLVIGSIDDQPFEANVILELDGREAFCSVEPERLCDALFDIDDLEPLFEAIYASTAYKNALDTYNAHD